MNNTSDTTATMQRIPTTTRTAGTPSTVSTSTQHAGTPASDAIQLQLYALALFTALLEPAVTLLVRLVRVNRRHWDAAYTGTHTASRLAAHLGAVARHAVGGLQALAAGTAALATRCFAGRLALRRGLLLATMGVVTVTMVAVTAVPAVTGIVTRAVGITRPAPAPTRAEFLALAAADTRVMGAPTLTAAELAAWYHARAGHQAQLPSLNGDVAALAQIFLDEGVKVGVRGDVAFVQSMLETSYLGFPSWGQIRPWFNNYSGMYAFDGRANGWECRYEARPSRCFATPADGVRVQLHLLRGYADAGFAHQPGVLSRPPWDRVGSAPTWELFGTPTGKIVWGSTPDYGARVLRAWRDAVAFTTANLPPGA